MKILSYMELKITQRYFKGKLVNIDTNKVDTADSTSSEASTIAEEGNRSTRI